MTNSTNINITVKIRMSFIARYIYTYEELVFVTEAPQCDRTKNKLKRLKQYTYLYIL